MKFVDDDDYCGRKNVDQRDYFPETTHQRGQRRRRRRRNNRSCSSTAWRDYRNNSPFLERLDCRSVGERGETSAGKLAHRSAVEVVTSDEDEIRNVIDIHDEMSKELKNMIHQRAIEKLTAFVGFKVGVLVGSAGLSMHCLSCACQRHGSLGPSGHRFFLVCV